MPSARRHCGLNMSDSCASLRPRLPGVPSASLPKTTASKYTTRSVAVPAGHKRGRGVSSGYPRTAACKPRGPWPAVSRAGRGQPQQSARAGSLGRP